MPFGDWIVGVFLKFSTDGPQTIGRLQASMEGLNDRIKVQNGLIDRNAALMAMQRRRMEELRASAIKYGANAAGIGAVVIGAGLAASVKQAADLQQKLQIYQMATGSSPSQMDAVRKQVFDTARQTAQSAANVAEQFVTISQMNLPMRLMTPNLLDQMAKYADVVNLQTRGQISTDDALKIGISTAHQLGIYDPRGITNALTAQMRTSFLLPHGLQRFSTQAKYYAPWIRLFGDSPENIMQVMSLANLIDVSGLSTGRGGTSVRAFMQNLLPALEVTKHQQSGKLALLNQMHLLRSDGTPKALVTDKQGRTYMDAAVFTDALAQYVDRQTAGKKGEDLIKARAGIVSSLEGVFGAQGGLFASILSTTGTQQLKTFHDRFSKTPKTIDQAQGELLDTFAGSVQKFTTSIDRFAAALALPALPHLSKVLSGLAQSIDRWTGSLVQHPGLAAGIFGGAAVTAVAGAGLWTARQVANVAGALKAMRAMPEAIEALKSEVSAAAKPVKALGGLVDQWGRPLTRAVTEAAKLAPELGEGAGLAGRLGLLFTATSKVLGPIGTLIDIIMAAKENYDYFKKYGAPWGPNFHPAAGDIDPMNKVQFNPKLLSPRQAAPGRFGGPPAPVHVSMTGPVKIVVPKGTTSQQAQSILQQIISLGTTAAGLPNPRTVGGTTAAHV